MSTNQSDNIKLVTKAIKEGSFFDRIALILSIWFGSGLLPAMPGTYGTVAAIPLYLVGSSLAPQYQLSILLIIVIGAIWSSHRSQGILGVVDPPEIVIDEVAGFLVTIILMPFTWPTLIAGVFLFRFFDILKPPPIKRIERRLKGRGAGVVFDDLVAGAYAHICLRFLLYVLN
jgi:phosphatidylglycerophosphatase A